MGETLSRTRGHTPPRPTDAGRTADADADAPPSPAGHEVAGVVAALLSDPLRPDPTRLPALGEPGRRPGARRPPALTALFGGPTGLGGTAARLASLAPYDVSAPEVAQLPAAALPAGRDALGPAGWWIAGEADASDASDAPASGGDAERPMPALFCPGPVRDDPALGVEVDERLVAWAEEVGIYPGSLDRLRACGFGRLIMLAHPGTDDPDRLLAATKCVVAEWAADDYYVDEVQLGADPEVVGSRLALLYAVADPAPLPSRYAGQLDHHRRTGAIETAFRSAMKHLAMYASDAQMGRFQHQMGILFTAWSQEADWHRNGYAPAVWEYLVQRNLNSYLPPMILMDVLAGYELAPHEFYDPLVRRAFMRAGAANVLLNDLHSAAFESDTDFNLPRVIAIEDGCSHEAAIRRTVEIHNEQMRTFVAEAATLSLTGSPMLQRFFVDTWAWMGGSREWHATTGRYHAAVD